MLLAMTVPGSKGHGKSSRLSDRLRRKAPWSYFTFSINSTLPSSVLSSGSTKWLSLFSSVSFFVLEFPIFEGSLHAEPTFLAGQLLQLARVAVGTKFRVFNATKPAPITKVILARARDMINAKYTQSQVVLEALQYRIEYLFTFRRTRVKV